MRTSFSDSHRRHVTLQIDATLYSARAILGISGTGATVAGNVQSTRRWKQWTTVSGGTGLTPGSHTFTLSIP
jgi:hypothetical protein